MGQDSTQSENAVIALDPGVQTFITGYDPSGQAVEWSKNNISSFLTYMTRFKVNITLFMEKYTNKNDINFAGSYFIYIKKSVVLLMIVTINLPNSCVKVTVLFCCLSLRHKKWLNVKNGRF